ncbi:acyl-CoA dehydratase activase [Fuchsiella alkaliacetigena]|uniref:acyl-CoA dehydratase activase n=1 Tax=Fuchsiella alkaliacetigena TaxID=957042 RepID=UPI00200AB1DD|nr:acyl-CoA dehydratase activase [Fuchsiella alkaliacetigena]MCK8824614.1 acyl-CoA dehydratase activase [Fuchsiella alkaliacetigena]
MKGFLGIDVGSVSINIVIIDTEGEVIDKIYLRTKGQPIDVVQRGMRELSKKVPDDLEIAGVGTTGSGRNLIGVVVGADTVKNEITAHAVASSHIVPDVQTVLEIGGQDSKITILRNGIVVDFAMNTVCAAGTGSFLDQQASRLGVPIEEFGDLALKSENKVRIAGRCSVFAESDMIHKQQMGHSLEDIIAGLCEALVRNYLNNVGQGKEILAPVVFQGGVAANVGIKKAFEEALETEVVIPTHYNVMGAIGAALLAKDKVTSKEVETNFKGWQITELEYTPTSFECEGCSNLCEVIEMEMDGELISRWGYKCNKWDIV